MSELCARCGVFLIIFTLFAFGISQIVIARHKQSRWNHYHRHGLCTTNYTVIEQINNEYILKCLYVFQDNKISQNQTRYTSNNLQIVQDMQTQLCSTTQTYDCYANIKNHNIQFGKHGNFDSTLASGMILVVIFGGFAIIGIIGVFIFFGEKIQNCHIRRNISRRSLFSTTVTPIQLSTLESAQTNINYNYTDERNQNNINYNYTDKPNQTNGNYNYTYTDEQQKLYKAINKLSLELKIPDEYLCPITHSVMIDPVICSDNYTYERKDITNALTISTNPTAMSPMTRQPNCQIIGENKIIKDQIKKFLIINKVYSEK